MVVIARRIIENMIRKDSKKLGGIGFLLRRKYLIFAVQALWTTYGKLK